jgi:hypothetical protein
MNVTVGLETGAIAAVDRLYVFEAMRSTSRGCRARPRSQLRRLKEVPSDETNRVGVCDVDVNGAMICPIVIDLSGGTENGERTDSDRWQSIN